MGTATGALVQGRNARTAIKSVTAGSGIYGIFDVTMSSSYANPGGDTINFGTAFGVIGGPAGTNQPTAVFPMGANGGNLPFYDLTNRKMLVYRQNGSTGVLNEAPNTTNLSAIVFRCLVFW